MSVVKLFKELWLKKRGWQVIDYPVSRKEILYQCTVYTHPKETGVWNIDTAIEREKLNHSKIDILEVRNK